LDFIWAVVKVSRNAPERRSGAPSKPKKAFRGPNMSISAPERSFWAPMTLFQTTYNYYTFGPGRVQNLKAAGPLGSSLRSLDPLVD